MRKPQTCTSYQWGVLLVEGEIEDVLTYCPTFDTKKEVAAYIRRERRRIELEEGKAYLRRWHWKPVRVTVRVSEGWE